MWECGCGDVDFLEVWVGMGVQYVLDLVLLVIWLDIFFDEELEFVIGQVLCDFILEQCKICDIVKVVNLWLVLGFSFVSEDLDWVWLLMWLVLCLLVVFYNLCDVKLMVVMCNFEVWVWMVWFFYNLYDELFDVCGWWWLIFVIFEELEVVLGVELYMKGK